MATGHDFQSLDLSAVTRDLTMVVTVGPNQIGEHFRVASIGLGAANMMTFPIPRRGQRVDRLHLVTGADQS